MPASTRAPFKRVAVTGLGVVTSIGSGWERFWEALLAGRSGIGPVTSFDTTAFPVHIGGEIRGFQPDAHLRRRRVDSMGRASHLAIAAAHMAIDDCRATLNAYDPRRVGVSLGTT